MTGTPMPLLELAAKGGSASLVRWCLERGASPADAPSATRDLAAEGRAEALRVLLAAGASPDDADDGGITPLHFAADRDHAACVDALLEAGASVDPRSVSRRYTPLMLAALHGFDACVERLLAAGASRELRDVDGRDALYWAKQGGHDACVALLAARKRARRS